MSNWKFAIWMWCVQSLSPTLWKRPHCQYWAVLAKHIGRKEENKLTEALWNILKNYLCWCFGELKVGLEVISKLLYCETWNFC